MCLVEVLVWATICTLNNATTALLDVFYKDLTVHVIGQMKANKSACYNAGAIFDSISSKPCLRKMPPSTLVMAEKSQKTVLFFQTKKAAGFVRFFEQKLQGLFKDFQGYISHFSRTPFSAKKTLESMSFLVLPQHEQSYPEGLSY